MSLRRRNSLSRGQGKFNRNEHLDIKGKRVLVWSSTLSSLYARLCGLRLLYFYTFVYCISEPLLLFSFFFKNRILFAACFEIYDTESAGKLSSGKRTC